MAIIEPHSKRQRERASYRWLGPTTIHLQHEFYLLVSLSLLTISSLQALYKNTFGLMGDIFFVLLSSLWLARYPIIRWLCTWDNSTNRRPTLTGVIAHWISSYFVAGQYFDRPNRHIVSKQIGTPSSDDGRGAQRFTLSSFLIPSVLYTWRMLKVWIWFPLYEIYEFLLRLLDQNDQSASPSTRHSSAKLVQPRRGEQQRPGSQRHLHPYVTTAYSYLSKFWAIYGTPLQMIIPVVTSTFYIWHLVFAATGPTQTSHALTMNTRSGQSQDFNNYDTKPYGAYKKLEIPSWSDVLFYLSFGGTLISILLYGRTILPFADLVAGNNVLKAVRNEAKLLGSQSSSGKSAKSKIQKESVDAPWAEQYKSIVGENRFRLICKIAFVRTLESLFICALLPRTGFSCRATGHCPGGAPLAELSKILYPVGISSTLRSDGSYQNEFALITSDRGAALMTILSIIHITGALLLAQALSLNRSYLSTMGYIAGEWTVVDESDPSIGGVTPSQWDPRRRYKKGDLIVQNFPGFGGQSIYRATSNSPEGRPFDLYLRATHDVFRNELGHQITSHVISVLANTQIVFLALLTVMILWYQFMDYHCGGLLWILAANIVAAYGLLNVGLPNLTEFQTLASEISKSY